MNTGNIFEAFFLAKEKIAKEPDIFSDPEYMKILQSVKKYFDSFVWVSNPTLIGEFQLSYDDAKLYTSRLKGTCKVKRVYFEKPIHVKMFANI